MYDEYYEYKKRQDDLFEEYKEKVNKAWESEYYYKRAKSFLPSEVYDVKRQQKKPITCDEFIDFYQLERITTGDFGV